MMKNCDSTLGCQVIQDFDLCKLDDLWTSFCGQKVVQNKIILNICASIKSTGMKFYRVDALQELHIVIVIMMSP